MFCLKVEVKHLQEENNVLKQELSIEKEKLHTLEGAFENMRKQGQRTRLFLASLVSESLSLIFHIQYLL